jgi:hypothetical protein
MNKEKIMFFKRCVFKHVWKYTSPVYQFAIAHKKLITFILVLILVISTWIATPFAVKMLYPEISHRGLFGDLFGCVNALFSGLAFAGLVWTILLQRNDLRTQYTEQKKQSQALQKQLRIMHQSTYLTALPKMIHFWRKDLESIGLISVSDQPSFTELEAARQILLSENTYKEKAQEADVIIRLIIKARTDLLSLYEEIDQEINKK